MIIKTKKRVYSPATDKILHYFFSFPLTEATLNQVVSKLQISKSSANKSIRQLLQEKFLQRKIVGRTWLLSCNQHHQYNSSRKIAYFLGEIVDSELLPALRKEFPSAKAIILFGSYRKGDCTDQSDVDIAIEWGVTKIIEWGKFEQLGYRRNVPINVHLISRKNININLFANIANGIVLDGFLEVQP
ncbi:MAG: nucleotidyltransferase domain-containing protein [Nanoarchaeota archaeon]